MCEFIEHLLWEDLREIIGFDTGLRKSNWRGSPFAENINHCKEYRVKYKSCISLLPEGLKRFGSHFHTMEYIILGKMSGMVMRIYLISLHRDTGLPAVSNSP